MHCFSCLVVLVAYDFVGITHLFLMFCGFADGLHCDMFIVVGVGLLLGSLIFVDFSECLYCLVRLVLGCLF